LIEYQEAAKSYANGVEVGFSTSKNLLVLNSVFAAIYQTNVGSENSDSHIIYLQNNVPYLGMLLAVFLALCIRPYYRHLNNCLARCVELESQFGGQLFSRNQKIGRRKINTETILFLLSAAIFLGWMLMSGIYKNSIRYFMDMFIAFS
jgi:hypothetical protein